MDIALPLAGVMTLWLGILNVGESWRDRLRVEADCAVLLPHLSASAEGSSNYRAHGDELFGEFSGPLTTPPPFSV